MRRDIHWIQHIGLFFGLNPCSNGMRRDQVWLDMQVQVEGLNPCSNGMRRDGEENLLKVIEAESKSLF